ncbi:glycoside hydrolase family 71 protein [Crucibulum laeve]|uniref:Glycoside hydrolase family 71 protein n=1 Tax=Crucibulum laeve TaxID=68775 RepID=A0A5C3MK57_9AGAR|nr:glycoside hydrolase family 71 protein [Crucibulum laeve]
MAPSPPPVTFTQEEYRYGLAFSHPPVLVKQDLTAQQVEMCPGTMPTPPANPTPPTPKPDVPMPPTPAPVATQKAVFVHFMVGNTYPYTVDDWLADLKLASTNEIDGFVLNVGREEWQKDRVRDCFKAADRLESTVQFKFVMSFDMSSIPSASTSDSQYLVSYLTEFGKHARMYKYPGDSTGKVVVSTFSGENSRFGQTTMEEGWAYVKRELNKIVSIHFIACFFVSPARYPGITAMDGAFNWNGGWPIHLKPGMPRSEIENPRLDSDQDHIKNLSAGKTFMAAVSPWFFTHYGPNSWNKNWIYRGDDWLFVRRWEQLIAMRDRVNIVQIISWNDYGESHYIGPIKGAQPNSQAWVDGYNHEAWMHLNRYFMKAFKTGAYPTIEKDQIFLWARPHPKDVHASEGVPRPTNWELTDDTLWAVILATTPATVEIYTTEVKKEIFEVKAGLTKLSCALTPDGGMRATMRRSAQTVAECNPVGFRFERRPGVHNFNAFVAMSR